MTADDIAGAPLTPQAEAWMKLHARNICYFWRHKDGDVRQYVSWNEDECRQHWPEFWTLWRQYVRAACAVDTHVSNTLVRYGT